MPKTLQFKRYNSNTLSTIVGAVGELIVDMDADTLTVHDGVLPGGYRLALLSEANTINNVLTVFSQAAFNKANSANITAQAAFNQANTATSGLPQSAFNQANAANILAQSAYTFANAVNAYAYSAYFQANITSISTQSAYNQANSATTGLTNRALNSGYTANTVLFANTTGYLATDASLSYHTSNASLVLTGTVNTAILGVSTSANIKTLSVSSNSYANSLYANSYYYANGVALPVGVSSIVAGTGISVSGTGAVTINSTGYTLNAQTAAYILSAGDAGKSISITVGGVTAPSSVFSPGNIVTIYNNSAINQSIIQGSGLTLQWAGQSTSTTGTRVLGMYGVATILYITANNAVITGAGLT
jgi:hypothetical protein